MKFYIAFALLSLSASCWCWEALPSIPTGRRSQFLVLHENGGYKYGYDTGDGNAAKQSGDSSNQVEGHYFYKNAAGQDVDLKYTAGVQGFVPENLDKILELTKSAPSTQYLPAVSTYSAPVVPAHPVAYSQYSASSASSEDDQAGTGDASYSFNVDTPTYKRVESSDARGNVQGSYSYSNEAGTHDLSYVAGENTGFVATSGSLSTANGLKAASHQSYSGGYGYSSPQHVASAGGYSYPAPQGSAPAVGAGNAQIRSNTDGSYAYSYATGDSSHHQSGDASGNVQGSYSYRNAAGSHDLSYVAGAATGFQVTGGSLAQPNGLAGSAVSGYAAAPVAAPVLAVKSAFSSVPVVPSNTYLPSASALSGSEDDESNTGDASYSFTVDTPDYKRTESSDASGNVKGTFSYKNEAGNNDLSFVAGSATGFLPTGGSLSDPNAITAKIASLPYAKSATVSHVPALPLVRQSLDSGAYSSDEQSSGDASYNFAFDTGDYKRTETSDAAGNVKGSFTYKNNAGNHDLSFVSGSGIGFQPTSGSLSLAPGASESQLRSGSVSHSQGYSYHAPSPVVSSYSASLVKSAVPVFNTVNSIVPNTKTSYNLGNINVKTYLPPSNEKQKFGYILDSKY